MRLLVVGERPAFRRLGRRKPLRDQLARVAQDSREAARPEIRAFGRREPEAAAEPIQSAAAGAAFTSWPAAVSAAIAAGSAARGTRM